MRVKDFIEDHVIYSDLSGTGVVSKYLDSDTSLNVKGGKALLSFINLGIVALHRKFVLDTKVIEKDVVDSINFVEIRDKDVGILLEVMSGDNTPLRFPSVESVDYDIKEVSRGKFLLSKPTFDKLFFIYTLTPARLTSLNEELPIPDLMLEALLHYMCYKGFSTLPSTVNQSPITMNDFYFKRFNKECTVLKDEGFDVVEDVISKNVQLGGWI